MATERAVPTPAPVRTRRRVASVGGQVLGIVGLVLCLALAIGVLLGRGWAVDQVRTVSGNVDDNLAKAVPVLVAAESKLSDVSAKVDAVTAAAKAVAATDAPSGPVVQALSDRLSKVSEAYLPLRTQYADARTRIVSALDRLVVLERFVPGLSVAQDASDAVAAIDARIKEVDAALTSVLGAPGAGGGLRAAAQTVVDKVATVTAALDAASTGVVAAQAKLDGVRTRLANTTDTAVTGINLGSVGLFVLLLWFALLHYVLFRYSRGLTATAA